MKIAISSEGNNLDSMVDQRFGRCKFFIFLDTDDKENFTVEENQGAIQGHGAGIKAAEQIGEQGAKVVITGALGPNSTNVLSQLNIKSFHASGKLKDVISDFIEGKLNEINETVAPKSGLVQESNNKILKKNKIFIPLLNKEGVKSKISDHFGNAPFFGLYDLDKKKLEIIENNLNHSDPTKSPIDQIEELINPAIIFAKGIGGRAIEIIAQKGICLKTGDYDTIEEVINNYDLLENQTKSCETK